MNSNDLDAILDSALDDFEEQALQEKLLAETKAHQDAESEHQLQMEELEKLEAQKQMQDLLASLQDPKYGDTLQSTLKSLSQTSQGIENVDELFDNLAHQFQTGLKPTLYPAGPNDTAGIQLGDREVAATMAMLGRAQQGMEGFEPAKLEEVGENMMEEMIQQFETLGEKEDYNEVIDGVMRQLLSKDLMYDPTKQICEKFPEWLAIHRKNLTQTEYNNYGKQYQCFQRILAVYDTEPDNFPRLMELMFDMQQYGQPPADIIKDLAPGLKFDENGMPIMPNMGAGFMPSMPGGEGLPNLAEMSQNMAQGQCIVC
jgi:peroxin-19